MILSCDVKNVKALGLLKTARDKRQAEGAAELSRDHLRLPFRFFITSYLIKRFGTTVTANMTAKRQVVPRDQVFPMFMIFPMSILTPVSSSKIKDDYFDRLCHAINGRLASSGLFLWRKLLGLLAFVKHGRHQKY